MLHDRDLSEEREKAPMPIASAPDIADGGVPAAAAAHEVVAVVLERYGRIALFKRSRSVQHDRGLWHCITGYIDPGASPQQQALVELHEETGLTSMDLSHFEERAPLLLADDSGNPWLVHTFKAVTTRRQLCINEEHDTYRWTAPAKVSRFINRVEWLDLTLNAALQQDQDHPTPQHPDATRTGTSERRRRGNGLRADQ
jgi:8-oxo-dGTP pyrophosphatase MutT (NUDIX family)